MAGSKLISTLCTDVITPVAAMKMLEQLRSRSSLYQYSSSGFEYKEAMKVCHVSDIFHFQLLVETMIEPNRDRFILEDRLDGSILIDANVDSRPLVESINFKVRHFLRPFPL